MSKQLIGSLDIYMGCMFSGKSTELQRYVRRLKTINAKYIIINHKIDIRYGENVVSTHDKDKIQCISMDKLYDIKKPIYKNLYESSKYIFIEEAQFFKDLYKFVLEAVNNDNKYVIVYGLDGDHEQNLFGDIVKLIPHADNVHKLKSLCKLCGDGTKALFTIRNLECLKVKDTPQILVGQEDTYMTVCRKHLKEHNIKKKNLTE